MASPDNPEQPFTSKPEREAPTQDYSGPSTVSQGGGDQQELPRRIGRYPVVDCRGAGAFGIVYLAQDETLERQVAIKVLARRRFRSDESVWAFLAEARKAAKLKHPGIVAIHDMGQDPACGAYVVMEFIEGQTLSQLLRSDRPGYTEAAKLVARVADAVHYAHTCGLVHRDLKPANILMTRHVSLSSHRLRAIICSGEQDSIISCPGAARRGTRSRVWCISKGTFTSGQILLAIRPDSESHTHPIHAICGVTDTGTFR